MAIFDSFRSNDISLSPTTRCWITGVNFLKIIQDSYQLKFPLYKIHYLYLLEVKVLVAPLLAAGGADQLRFHKFESSVASLDISS
jgi:hypothetical protein